MKLQKYIIISNYPILFDKELLHSKVAGENKDIVESAGYVFLYTVSERVGAICMGQSDSLGIPSRGAIDAELIQKLLN